MLPILNINFSCSFLPYLATLCLPLLPYNGVVYFRKFCSKIRLNHKQRKEC